MKNIIVLVLISLTLIGCGRIETNMVGVRTTFTGEVKTQEEPQGFYTAFTSNVMEFSCKEITISLQNMQPKAGDNLTMKDLDIDVYYTVKCDQTAEQHLKYSNRTQRDPDLGVYYAGYNFVGSRAREAAYDAVALFDSLDVHKNRELIRETIREQTQRMLDGDDPGVYHISKVIIENAVTDPSVEDSIRLAVQKDKELEAVQKQVEILKQQALANQQLQVSLTPEILTQKYLEVLTAAADSGNLKLVDLGCQGGALLNIPMRDE